MDILRISWDRICQSLLAILFYLFTTRHFKNERAHRSKAVMDKV